MVPKIDASKYNENTEITIVKPLLKTNAMKSSIEEEKGSEFDKFADYNKQKSALRQQAATDPKVFLHIDL